MENIFRKKKKNVFICNAFDCDFENDLKKKLFLLTSMKKKGDVAVTV